jgi:hypothetical protein
MPGGRRSTLRGSQPSVLRRLDDEFFHRLEAAWASPLSQEHRSMIAIILTRGSRKERRQTAGQYYRTLHRIVQLSGKLSKAVEKLNYDVPGCREPISFHMQLGVIESIGAQCVAAYRQHENRGSKGKPGQGIVTCLSYVFRRATGGRVTISWKVDGEMGGHLQQGSK